MGIVHDKLMLLGADMVVETVDAIIDGTFKTIPQEELTGGKTPTPAPKIFKETCHLDWTKSAESVHNLVRGLSPYPAAWNTVDKADKEIQLKIYETARTGKSTVGAVPGSITTSDGRIMVACADEYLQINSLQQSGKKRMDYKEFLRGFDLNGLQMK